MSENTYNKLLPYYKEILNSIPESIDFNFIPAKQVSSRIITLTNSSEISIYYKITNAEGYIFKPNEGILSKNKPMNIEILIEPNTASVLIANAQITLDKKISKIFKLSCVSKYPYLTINRTNLNLGVIEYGKSSYGEIIISNNEMVPGKFSIIQTSVQPGKHPQIFKLSAMKGEIPPQNSFLVKVNFTPFFPRSTSYETYEIRTSGGNTLKFSLTGGCTPLKIFLNCKHINFGTVELGNSMTKLIRIYNESDMETDYQILHSNGSSVFYIKDQEIQGTVRPHTNIRVNVTFKPNQTSLFYERIFIISKNHGIFPLDLYGSCHDLLNKTLLLNQKFIDTFRNRLLCGEFFVNNIKYKNPLIEEEIKSNTENIKIDAGNSLSSLIKTESGISNIQLQLQREILWETTSETRIISFSQEHIDFHFVGVGETSSPASLTVNNNTNKKINLKWILERPIIISNLIKTVNLFQNDDSIFIIQPEEVIINPHSNYDFKIYFKPNKQEYYFYNDIPCFATVIENDNEFNNFQLIKNGKKNIFNQTTMGFNAFNHEKEKKDIELNKPNFPSNKMGATAINFKSNGSKKNNQLKPLPFKGASNPYQTSYNNNQQKKTSSKTNNNLLSNNPKTQMNFRTKKLKHFSGLNQESNLKKTKSSLLSDVPYFNPPFCTYLSVVGHSFPPGTQLYIPMFDFIPKNEIFFPCTSINQPQYQIFKIKNRSDTPLFYSISPDPSNIFRVARKYGLIPANQFHLILIEFCPNETTTYRYPLRITLNHDNSSVKNIILNGFCVDPVIEIEGIKEEIYFPPSFIGITTKKKLTIINRSPIKIKVEINIDKNEEGKVEINPNYFEMESNLIMDIIVSFTPLKPTDIKTKIKFKVERIYDEQKDLIGIYSPSSLLSEFKLEKNGRPYIKELSILGKGSDGDLRLEPSLLEFGTVKVGFHKKLSFSIYNPTMTNFYIILEPEKKEYIDENGGNMEGIENINDIVTFDFKEGLINSFCKKEVQVLFKPINRYLVKMKVNVYAIEHQDSALLNLKKAQEEKKNSFPINNDELSKIKSLKCELTLTANGDYPLIRIADVRNNLVGTNNLWYLFDVDQANEELQKQLTDEEINYIGEDKTDNKIKDFKDKLKCITLNFGKHIKKKQNNNDTFNVYLTLRNDGGVPTEFFFKFPGEVSIFREVWMDPVEPSSNDKFEYHVLKDKIFELEPRKGKLEPNECCNIRLKYNFKEKGNHQLHVLFQVVNGKPLIFKFDAVCFTERQGMLEIKRPLVDFSYVPIGYMDYIVCPLELYNVGGIKIRYKIDQKQIDEFNKKNDNFQIFKIEQLEGNIGPNDLKYIPIFFRPLTSKEYILNINVFYADEAFYTSKTDELELYNNKEKIDGIGRIPVQIRGYGYHPKKFTPPMLLSPFAKMPKERICNSFGGEIIQKCGLSIEEIDFGACEEGVPKNQTFIIYNYSKTNSFNFEFYVPGFILKDNIEIKPNKDKLEPNSHKIIKMILTPKGYISNYDGEIEIKINWNNPDNSIDPKLTKEILHIRIRKISVQKEIQGKVEKTLNKNQSFIETLLSDLTREIMGEEDYQKNLCKLMDEQPLGLFDWTNDVEYPSQEEVRNKIEERFNKQSLAILLNENNLNKTYSKKLSTMHMELRNQRSSGRNNDNNASSINEKTVEVFNELEDIKIQEKYTKELLSKYKLTVGEINENLAVVNEESRKIISNEIMENTIYNIISEAIYGEADLSEKTRIYFFNK